jgi:hypothetical protein
MMSAVTVNVAVQSHRLQQPDVIIEQRSVRDLAQALRLSITECGTECGSANITCHKINVYNGRATLPSTNLNKANQQPIYPAVS